MNNSEEVKRIAGWMMIFSDYMMKNPQLILEANIVYKPEYNIHSTANNIVPAAYISYENDAEIVVTVKTKRNLKV